MPRMIAHLAAVAVACAAVALSAGCGLEDPMATTSTVAAAPTSTSDDAPPAADSEAAAERFALAYVDLLNRRGPSAEAELRQSAGAELAKGLIAAALDAQLTGEAGAGASSRLLGVAPAGGGRWRATFATGALSWAMLVTVGAADSGRTIVTAAITEPVE